MSDPNPPPGLFENLHAGWTAIFTGIAFFFLRRTIKQLDDKADKTALRSQLDALEDHKTETDRKFAAMQASINHHIDTQIQQHADNTARLDNILLKLTERRD